MAREQGKQIDMGFGSGAKEPRTVKRKTPTMRNLEGRLSVLQAIPVADLPPDDKRRLYNEENIKKLKELIALQRMIEHERKMAKRQRR